MAVGLAVYGDDLAVPLLLGLATGIGRLCVVPLARRPVVSQRRPR